MTQDNGSSKPKVASSPQSGSDQVLEMMRRMGLPITQENYLSALGYNDLSEVDAEAMIDIPDFVALGIPSEADLPSVSTTTESGVVPGFSK